MSISYDYYPQDGYIHTKVTKLITLPEVLSYVDEILDDNRIDKPFYELVDLAYIKSTRQ